jgi:hypothetical protein
MHTLCAPKILPFPNPTIHHPNSNPHVKTYLGSHLTGSWPGNAPERQELGDFVRQTCETAVREPTTPIADVTTVNTLVGGVVSGNPDNSSAGEQERTQEVYPAKAYHIQDESW